MNAAVWKLTGFPEVTHKILRSKIEAVHIVPESNWWMVF